MSARMTDEERAKRIGETAREIGISQRRGDFERVFKKVVLTKEPPKSSAGRSRRGEKPASS
jgi:hypothetical protein